MSSLNHFHTSFFIIFSLFIITVPAFSQTDTTIYAVADYMKVKPGGGPRYLELEQKVWKPIHQERLKAGMIVGWYLYGVRFPSGSNYEYNFATVNVVNKFSDLENPLPEEIFTKVYPNKDVSEIMDETINAREMTHQDIWVVLDYVHPETPSSTPSQYIDVDFMKVKPGGMKTYLDLEQKIWKPIHQQRLESGFITGWRLYALIFPAGSNYEYNYCTVNSYKKFVDLEKPYTDEILIKTLRNMTLSEMWDKTHQAREFVRSEIWQLIDYVQ
jgi:hypothetical protein